MALRYTGRPKIGPFRINMGSHGPSSISLKLGPVTWRVWSRRQRSGMSSVDLPGPFSWRPARRRRG